MARLIGILEQQNTEQWQTSGTLTEHWQSNRTLEEQSEYHGIAGQMEQQHQQSNKTTPRITANAE